MARGGVLADVKPGMTGAMTGTVAILIIIIIIRDNFCIALFSRVPKLTALYNILQHFLSFTNIIHIIMTTNNV